MKTEKDQTPTRHGSRIGQDPPHPLVTPPCPHPCRTDLDDRGRGTGDGGRKSVTLPSLHMSPQNRVDPRNGDMPQMTCRPYKCHRERFPGEQRPLKGRTPRVTPRRLEWLRDVGTLSTQSLCLWYW